MNSQPIGRGRYNRTLELKATMAASWNMWKQSFPCRGLEVSIVVLERKTRQFEISEVWEIVDSKRYELERHGRETLARMRDDRTCRQGENIFTRSGMSEGIWVLDELIA